jgi:hypothetical protein
MVQYEGRPLDSIPTKLQRRLRSARARAVHLRPAEPGCWSSLAVAARRAGAPPRSVLRASLTALRLPPACETPECWAVFAAVLLAQDGPGAGVESALCRAVQLGGEGGTAAAVALARLYLVAAASAQQQASPSPAQLLSAASSCLQAARSTPSNSASVGAAWLATALLQRAEAGDSEAAALAALQAASAAGGEPEADARLALALLARSEQQQVDALAPAVRAAAWRPACVHCAAAAAGALHARSLPAQAAVAYDRAVALSPAQGAEMRLRLARAAADAHAAAANEQMAAAQLHAALSAACESLRQGLALPAGSRCAASLLAAECRAERRSLDAHVVHCMPSLPLAYAREAREEAAGGTEGGLWLRLHACAARSLLRRVERPSDE